MIPGNCSPAPWSINERGIIEDADGVVLNGGDKTQEELNANARVIVAAVNKFFERKTLLDMVDDLLWTIEQVKPEDRSELDRNFAILRTDIQKVKAYVKTYIAEG